VTTDPTVPAVTAPSDPAAERSPLRLAAGVLALLFLTLWAFFELDSTTAKGAEHRERQALSSLHVRLTELERKCTDAKAASRDAGGPSSAEGACTAAEEVRGQILEKEAAYRRACGSCATPEECEDAVKAMWNPSFTFVQPKSCR
jgi:hypothetical protein